MQVRSSWVASRVWRVACGESRTLIVVSRERLWTSSRDLHGRRDEASKRWERVARVRGTSERRVCGERVVQALTLSRRRALRMCSL